MGTRAYYGGKGWVGQGSSGRLMNGGTRGGGGGCDNGRRWRGAGP